MCDLYLEQENRDTVVLVLMSQHYTITGKGRVILVGDNTRVGKAVDVIGRFGH